MKLFYINNDIVLIISALIAFLVTYITIPTIIRMSHFKNLFDETNERKLHTENIPRLGGIGFFAGLVISVLLFVDPSEMQCFGSFIAGLIILFFIGLKDDIIVIAPFTKFIGQFLATFIIVIFGNVMITDLHGFFGINEIHWLLGVVITFFVFLVTINAFNFIDGIDGLSSSIGMIASTAFGVWFVLVKEYYLAIISFSMASSLIAFLRFNLFCKKNKIFMGDTGSMIIGFVVSFLAIEFNQKNIGGIDAYHVLPSPAVAFGILIVPYFDMLRVMYIRILKGQKLFNADKNHIHHLFLRLGFSHKQIVLTVSLFNIAFIVLVFYFSSFITIRRLLLIELLIILFASFIPEIIVKRRKNKQQ